MSTPASNASNANAHAMGTGRSIGNEQEAAWLPSHSRFPLRGQFLLSPETRCLWIKAAKEPNLLRSTIPEGPLFYIFVYPVGMTRRCSIWEDGKQCPHKAKYWIFCERHRPPDKPGGGKRKPTSGVKEHLDNAEKIASLLASLAALATVAWPHIAPHLPHIRQQTFDQLTADIRTLEEEVSNIGDTFAEREATVISGKLSDVLSEIASSLKKSQGTNLRALRGLFSQEATQEQTRPVSNKGQVVTGQVRDEGGMVTGRVRDEGQATKSLADAATAAEGTSAETEA